MRTSCIKHPANSRYTVIRPHYTRICRDNACAGILLSFFESWHNHRLDQQARARQQNLVAERHNEVGTQDTGLYQFHTEEALEEATGWERRRKYIAECIDLLVELGFVQVARNPNPRYRFDRTRHFLFVPSAVQKAISEYEESTSSPEGLSIIPTDMIDQVQKDDGDPCRDDGPPPKDDVHNNAITTVIVKEPLPEKSRARKRHEYTEVFDRFWDAVPTPMKGAASKRETYQEWLKIPDLEKELPAIRAGFERMMAFLEEKPEKAEFMKRPNNWLKYECWKESYGQPTEVEREASIEEESRQLDDLFEGIKREQQHTGSPAA